MCGCMDCREIDVCASSRIESLRDEVLKLRAALADVFSMIDDGFLGRDISKDHEPDWYEKTIPYIIRLNRAHTLLKVDAEIIG